MRRLEHIYIGYRNYWKKKPLINYWRFWVVFGRIETRRQQWQQTCRASIQRKQERHTQLNLIQSSRNKIVFTIFRLIWNQTENDRKDPAQMYQSQLYFNFLNILNQFLGEKISFYRFFLQSFFFKLLPKFRDFVNSTIASEKSHQSLSEYIQFFIKNRFEVIKKYFSSSGN